MTPFLTHWLPLHFYLPSTQPQNSGRPTPWLVSCSSVLHNWRWAFVSCLQASIWILYSPVPEDLTKANQIAMSQVANLLATARSTSRAGDTYTITGILPSSINGPEQLYTWLSFAASPADDSRVPFCVQSSWDKSIVRQQGFRSLARNTQRRTKPESHMTF